MTDEKATEPARSEIDEGISNSNYSGHMPDSCKNQSSNHGVKMEVDVEDKAVLIMKEVVEEKAVPVEGGELDRFSEGQEVLEGEEGNCSEVRVENKGISCKRRFGSGLCKHTGEEFCLKHRKLAKKSTGVKSNGKSKINNVDGENVIKEEMGNGSSILMEEEVLRKSERKRKAVVKESDGSEIVFGESKETPGGRTRLSKRNRSSNKGEVNYGVDEACAAKTGSGRRKDPNVPLDKVSGPAANLLHSLVNLDSLLLS